MVYKGCYSDIGNCFSAWGERIGIKLIADFKKLQLKLNWSLTVIFLFSDTPECAPGTASTMIGALRQETVEVKCTVKSNPETGVKFSWTYNNSRETLPIPGSRVYSDGVTSSVQYTPVTDTDFGTLACWASNQIGKQKVPCYVHIIQASKFI